MLFNIKCCRASSAVVQLAPFAYKCRGCSYSLMMLVCLCVYVSIQTFACQHSKHAAVCWKQQRSQTKQPPSSYLLSPSFLSCFVLLLFFLHLITTFFFSMSTSSASSIFLFLSLLLPLPPLLVLPPSLPCFLSSHPLTTPSHLLLIPQLSLFLMCVLPATDSSQMSTDPKLVSSQPCPCLLLVLPAPHCLSCGGGEGC